MDGKPAGYDRIDEKIPLSQWDEETTRVKKTYANAAYINNKIDKRIAELQGTFLKLEAVGTTITRTAIKGIVKGNDPGQCFHTFCRNQIIAKYGNKDTRRTYEGEVTKLEEYKPHLAFRDITFLFLQNYGAWLRENRGNAPNTIWKTFKFMNTMLNDAIKIGGYIDKNPFEVFDRGSYVQTPRTFLTKTDRPKVEKLMSEPIPEEVAKVTAYMLLMVYAGLRFEDAMSFDYNTHIIDDERLLMLTEKMDVLANIKLYPKLREIVLFIRDHPLKMSNRDFNDNLKIVSALAGLNKHITAHVGRHSFGRLLAEKGIPLEKAQKLMAHKDKRSTEIYYHMLDIDVDQEVDNKLGGL